MRARARVKGKLSALSALAVAVRRFDHDRITPFTFLCAPGTYTRQLERMREAESRAVPPWLFKYLV
jgi:hypothetical protein